MSSGRGQRKLDICANLSSKMAQQTDDWQWLYWQTDSWCCSLMFCRSL